jgi:hypothetical protein
LEGQMSSSPLLKKHTSLFMDPAISDTVVHAWESYNVALDQQPLLTKCV